MKKFLTVFKISLVCVPIGIALLTAGVIKEILWLTVLGGCLIGAYAVTAVAVYAAVFVISVKNRNAENGGDGKKTENELIETVNSTVGIPNETAVHERQTAVVMNNARQMGSADALVLVCVILFILGAIAAVVVLIVKGFYLPAVITALSAIAAVACFIIAANLIAKSRMNGEGFDASLPPVSGEVLSCVIYTETSTSTGTNNAYQSTQKTRIKSTVYKLRVKICVADDRTVSKSAGREKVVTVFADSFYNVGSEVVLLKHKSKNRYIIKQDE